MGPCPFHYLDVKHLKQFLDFFFNLCYNAIVEREGKPIKNQKGNVYEERSHGTYD